VGALLAAAPRVAAVVPALRAAAEPGQRVALVGGVVRDLLRGDEPREVDVAVEGDGIAFARRLAEALGVEVRVHGAFGTATVLAEPPIDVATCRRERYAHPGALPEVEPAPLEEDLGRRDLTWNAIALDVGEADGDARLLDPLGGADDLAAGRLRLLRPDAFAEDGTRAVRVARYAARLGATDEDGIPAAARAAAAAGQLSAPGPTRMLDALRLVFHEPDPAAVLERLADWGALDGIEPGLGADAAAVRAAWALLGVAPDADPEALGLGLLVGGLAPERRRAWLGAGGAERGVLRAALAVADAGALRDAVRGRGDGEVDAACARVPVEAVVAAGGDEARRHLERLRHVRLAVDGDDVRRVTSAEGPAIGRALADLRAAVLDGQVAGEREAQLAWLEGR
jgi:tRNA nucleotidyltransferase (CCA-adding enzyme)